MFSVKCDDVHSALFTVDQSHQTDDLAKEDAPVLETERAGTVKTCPSDRLCAMNMTR